jgi:hypothetical protein|tara:strand:- start:539 stop:787 length:249 start_codon:yes stop_codon:yes gene_type:complete
MKDDRGDNDLEVVIDKLTKQKEFLQFQCRKAGSTIEGYKMLIEEQKKEIWQLKLIASENEKNKNLLQGYKNVIDDLSSRLVK